MTTNYWWLCSVHSIVLPNLPKQETASRVAGFSEQYSLLHLIVSRIHDSFLPSFRQLCKTDEILQKNKNKEAQYRKRSRIHRNMTINEALAQGDCHIGTKGKEGCLP